MNGQIGHLMQTDVGTPGPEQPSSSVKVVPHCEGHKGNLSAEDKGSQVLLYNCGGQAPGQPLVTEAGLHDKCRLLRPQTVLCLSSASCLFKTEKYVGRIHHPGRSKSQRTLAPSRVFSTAPGRTQPPRGLQTRLLGSHLPGSPLPRGSSEAAHT